ncbi:MAG TPA: DUF507 family protein [Candidatus Polarisedimenticolia bacterium]|jgi:hypothetical protein
MKLSHEKVTHLSHVLTKALEEAPGITLLRDRNSVRLKVVELLRAEMRRDEEVEKRVRAKIVGQKRQIPEGSQEWDILFRKYYEEELGKIRGSRG